MGTNKVVNAISKLNFAGNMIPHSWFQTIVKGKTNKPDLVAIMILSEIVYWYRGFEMKDEDTLKVTGYMKRFKADKFQISSRVLADRFGFSQRQVSDAISRLRDSKLITTEYRDLNLQSGTINNVQYIEPKPIEIEKITFQPDDTPRKNLRYPSQKNTTPLAEIYDVTETTNSNHKQQTTNESIPNGIDKGAVRLSPQITKNSKLNKSKCPSDDAIQIGTDFYDYACKEFAGNNINKDAQIGFADKLINKYGLDKLKLAIKRVINQDVYYWDNIRSLRKFDVISKGFGRRWILEILDDRRSKSNNKSSSSNSSSTSASEIIPKYKSVELLPPKPIVYDPWVEAILGAEKFGVFNFQDPILLSRLEQVLGLLQEDYNDEEFKAALQYIQDSPDLMPHNNRSDRWRDWLRIALIEVTDDKWG